MEVRVERKDGMALLGFRRKRERGNIAMFQPTARERCARSHTLPSKHKRKQQGDGKIISPAIYVTHLSPIM